MHMKLCGRHIRGMFGALFGAQISKKEYWKPSRPCSAPELVVSYKSNCTFPEVVRMVVLFAGAFSDCKKWLHKSTFIFLLDPKHDVSKQVYRRPKPHILGLTDSRRSPLVPHVAHVAKRPLQLPPNLVRSCSFHMAIGVNQELLFVIFRLSHQKKTYPPPLTL